MTKYFYSANGEMIISNREMIHENFSNLDMLENKLLNTDS
jgi:hypothetical protein